MGFKRPPGPAPRFFIGNMPLAARRPLDLILKWASRYGDIFYYRFLWVHVYVLNHPDLIDYVLVRNPKNFLKDRAVRNARWVLGEGLLSSEGDHWKRQRKLAQPAFHRHKVESYAAIMTEYTEQMAQQWSAGGTFDVHEQMMQLTLRIVVRTLFGMETSHTKDISRSLTTVMRNSSGARLILPGFARWLPLPGMKELRRAVSDLDRTIYQIIRQRRAANAESDDLLSMLMESRDEDGASMDDKQVRDETMTFFLAGHETTALALSWACHLLSRHPEAERQLHAELDSVLQGRTPTLADLTQLPFTDGVVKEALRLYPPAWAIARTTIEEFELGGYRIPAGANIVMSQWVMHRDPRYFPEPEKFDPARWSTERTEKLPRFAWFPFGGGPRQCIGNAFALMEASLLLAVIASRFELDAADEAVAEPVPGFTLRPRNGVRLQVKRRQAHA